MSFYLRSKLKSLLRIRISRGGAILVAGFFLALKALPFLSFLVRNPAAFTFGSFCSCLGNFIDVGFVLVMFLGFAYYGSLLLQIFRFKEAFQELEILLLSVVLGEAAVSFLIMSMGLLNLYHSFWLSTVYALLAWGAFKLRKRAADALGEIGHFISERVSLFSAACVVVVSLAWLRAAVAACAPPINWDCLAYHLACPKIYWMQGRMLRIPWSINAHYPFNTEMIYLLCIALRNDLAAQWTNVMHATLMLAALCVLVRKYLSPEAAGLAAALFVAQPVFMYVTGNALTDVNLAFICLMAIVVFLRENKETDFMQRRLGFLCGALAGIAMSVKITGAWIVAVLVILRIWRIVRDKEGIPAAIPFFLGFILCGAPWYFRNLILTGNPIWPYLGGLFGASHHDLAIWRRIHSSVTEGVGISPLKLGFLPLWLAFKPHVFHHQPVLEAFPFILLLGIRITERRSFQPMEKIWLSLIGLWTLCWFFVYQDWRYFMPAAALMAGLISFWIVKAQNRNQRIIAILAALFALIPLKDISANNELYAAFHLQPQRGVISSRQRYLELSLGATYVVEEIANRILPPKAKVLMYRDVRGYYLDRDYAWGDPLNSGVVDFSAISDSQELFAQLRTQGFGYVLYDPWIGNYKGDQNYYRHADRLMAGVLSCSRKLASVGGVILYHLPASLDKIAGYMGNCLK
jgi:hypothetical protein